MNKEDVRDLLQIAMIYYEGGDLNDFPADPELMKMGIKLAIELKESKFSTTYRITPNDIKKIGR